MEKEVDESVGILSGFEEVRKLAEESTKSSDQKEGATIIGLLLSFLYQLRLY